jgi:hypothetical protein
MHYFMDIHVMIFKNTQNGQKVFAVIQRGVGGNSSQSKPKAYVCFIVLSATCNNLSVISISFIG